MRRAGRALIARAKEGPVYVLSAADRKAIESLAADAEQAAAAAGALPRWPECAPALCGSWQLVATTRTRGGEVLQQMGKQPALGTFRVTQRLFQPEGQDTLRCSNVVTVGRPNDGLLSAWTLLPKGAQSSLKLLHSARVVAAGEPLKLCIELDGLIVDGNRAAGAAVEPIVAMNLPPILLPPSVPVPPLPPPPPLPGPIATALDEAGTFEVTFLDESVRISRAPGGVLRVFARVDELGQLPTW